MNNFIFHFSFFKNTTLGARYAVTMQYKKKTNDVIKISEYIDSNSNFKTKQSDEKQRKTTSFIMTKKNPDCM